MIPAGAEQIALFKIPVAGMDIGKIAGVICIASVKSAGVAAIVPKRLTLPHQK